MTAAPVPANAANWMPVSISTLRSVRFESRSCNYTKKGILDFWDLIEAFDTVAVTLVYDTQSVNREIGKKS